MTGTRTRHVVVTGTDTGVGKTFVTVQLLAQLRRNSNAIGLKPIETGWSGRLSDAWALAEASGRALDQTIAHHFDLPAAPKMAVEHEGAAELSLGELATWIRAQSEASDLCFVEGAGGWLVPWSNSFMLPDLAVALDAGVLVVGRAGLGTINHTLLTLEVVRRTSKVLAVALSLRPDESAAFAERNAKEIMRISKVPTHVVPENLRQLTATFHVEQQT